MTRRVNGKEEVGIYSPTNDQHYMGPDHCAAALGTTVSSVYKVLKGTRKTLKGLELRWEVFSDTPK